MNRLQVTLVIGARRPFALREHEADDVDIVDEDTANESKDEDEDDSSENEDEEYEVFEDDEGEQEVCVYPCKDEKMLRSNTALSLTV